VGASYKRVIGSELLPGDRLSAQATSSFRLHLHRSRPTSDSRMFGHGSYPTTLVKPFDECLTCRTLQKDGLGASDGNGLSAW
jgi:hypothetical protein